MCELSQKTNENEGIKESSKQKVSKEFEINKSSFGLSLVAVADYSDQ